MIIDCSECELYKSKACEDCFVTAVLSHDEGPLSMDEEETEAVGALQQVGLAPILLFKKRAS